MSILPSSLALTVHTRRRACVLDTQLALSPYGLLLARRLGEVLDLWLVRELWQILDSTYYYRSNPSQLIPPIPGTATITAPSGNCQTIGTVLAQWDLARAATDLAGLKVYWVGDALNESLLPAGTDTHLISRFETLAAALESAVPNAFQNDEQPHLFSDCSRDTAALAAALIPYKGFILTSGSKGDEPEPLLCTYLKEHFHISCVKLGRKQSRLERDFLNSILAEAALSELLWAGLKLAALHLVVPGAVMMPVNDKSEETFPHDFDLPAEATGEHEQQWWKDARCFWYPVGP
ncbi:MAG: hypothetical protein OEL83_14240 [Desulforhopalus sp.]|nr:hypothetical protein [Desulforhopalus sp.]